MTADRLDKFHERQQRCERVLADALVSFFRACQEWDRSRSRSALRALGRAGSRVYNAASSIERVTEQAARAGAAVIWFERDAGAEVLRFGKSQRFGSE